MKLVSAIIKPFKLDEVREALSAHRRAGHHRHRGQGIRPAERPYGALSRRRIRRRLPAQGEDRGGDRRRPPRARHRSDREGAPTPARSATARSSSSTSSRSCASAPARPARTRSKGSLAMKKILACSRCWRVRARCTAVSQDKAAPPPAAGPRRRDSGRCRSCRSGAAAARCRSRGRDARRRRRTRATSRGC